MLQTRSGKMNARGHGAHAVEMIGEGLIYAGSAPCCASIPKRCKQLLAPRLRRTFRAASRWRKGLPASPGAASGQVVFAADTAGEWARQGKQVILVREETVPDDIHGMFVAQGILTAAAA